MSGSNSDGGEWYCGWHFRCVSSPSLIKDFPAFEKFHKSRQDPWDEIAKKHGLPANPNPWRGSVLQLWKKVGGEHGSNYKGDRMQDSSEADRSFVDELNQAAAKLGKSGAGNE